MKIKGMFRWRQGDPGVHPFSPAHRPEEGRWPSLGLQRLSMVFQVINTIPRENPPLVVNRFITRGGFSRGSQNPQIFVILLMFFYCEKISPRRGKIGS